MVPEKKRESEPWLSEALLKARAWLPVRHSLNETEAKLAETAGAGKSVCSELLCVCVCADVILGVL